VSFGKSAGKHFFFIVFSTLNHIKPKSTPETQATTVQDLISRTLPAEASLFDVKVDPDLGNNDLNDVFRVSSTT
jgi:hypothetical protein